MRRQSSFNNCSIDWDPGLQNLYGLFAFCTHLIASSERDIPVIGRSELINTRTWVKTNCLKLVIFRNDPLYIHWRTAWTGLSETVTLFNNLMHNWLLKKMVINIFWFFNYFTITAPKCDWWISFVVEYVWRLKLLIDFIFYQKIGSDTLRFPLPPSEVLWPLTLWYGICQFFRCFPILPYA